MAAIRFLIVVHEMHTGSVDQGSTPSQSPIKVVYSIQPAAKTWPNYGLHTPGRAG